MTVYSYRVAWRRDYDGYPGPLIVRHYETWDAASKKVRRLKSLDAALASGEFDGTSFDSMPPIRSIELQQREVSPWEASPCQPEPTEYDARAAARYADQLRREKMPKQEVAEEFPF